MPNRLLRDWTDSLRFDGISADAERLFVRLIMKADDYGRFHAEPRLIKANCFPLLDNLRPPDIDRWLDELSTRQLILRYEAEGRSLLAIVNYGQRLKQSRAKFPPPDGKPADFLPVSEHFREVPGTSGNVRLEEKGRETEGEAGSRTPAEGGGARSAGGSRQGKKPSALMLANINSLRAGWGSIPELTHLELQHYLSNEAALESIAPDTWDVMRAYMAAKLPQGDPGWQPKQRLKFLEAPSDLVGHAIGWEIKRPKPKSSIQPPEPKPPEGATFDDPKDALDFFRNAGPAKPDNQKPDAA